MMLSHHFDFIFAVIPWALLQILQIINYEIPYFFGFSDYALFFQVDSGLDFFVTTNWQPT